MTSVRAATTGTSFIPLAVVSSCCTVSSRGLCRATTSARPMSLTGKQVCLLANSRGTRSIAACSGCTSPRLTSGTRSCQASALATCSSVAYPLATSTSPMNCPVASCSRSADLYWSAVTILPLTRISPNLRRTGSICTRSSPDLVLGRRSPAPTRTLTSSATDTSSAVCDRSYETRSCAPAGRHLLCRMTSANRTKRFLNLNSGTSEDSCRSPLARCS